MLYGVEIIIGETVEISEVEELLNSLRLMGFAAPRHVFITDESIYASVDGKVFFRGLAVPRRDVIVLSRDADLSTVFHELVHSRFGLGETVAKHAGRLLALRYELAKVLPFSKLKIKEVRYQEVDDVPAKFRGRVRHYVRVE